MVKSVFQRIPGLVPRALVFLAPPFAALSAYHINLKKTWDGKARMLMLFSLVYTATGVSVAGLHENLIKPKPAWIYEKPWRLPLVGQKGFGKWQAWVQKNPAVGRYVALFLWGCLPIAAFVTGKKSGKWLFPKPKPAAAPTTSLRSPFSAISPAFQSNAVQSARSYVPTPSPFGVYSTNPARFPAVSPLGY